MWKDFGWWLLAAAIVGLAYWATWMAHVETMLNCGG